jgi:hypothetical protein
MLHTFLVSVVREWNIEVEAKTIKDAKLQAREIADSECDYNSEQIIIDRKLRK